MRKKELLVVFLVFMAGISIAAKPVNDYSFIRGVCYPSGWMGDQATIERDLGYAQKLQLNSTRIWLGYRFYKQDPEKFIKKLRNYVRTANKMGISTMPILWNGNMIDPAIFSDDFREEGKNYVKAVVNSLKDEEGLLMWDIMNEPSCNDYFRNATGEEKTKHENEIWNFVRFYCKYVKEIDTKNAITVGVTYPRFLEQSADLVDVLSFHDYLETRQRVENSYLEAEKISLKYNNKPLINSEMACLCRANPYDMAIDICEKHKVGWYVFDLIIEGYWGDVHGLVYPDGTVRDPSIIAALLGFQRNRDIKTSIKPNPNKEGFAYEALNLLENAMKQETKVFRNKKTSTDEILEAAEYCANLLEACEMVPMYDPPTAKIRAWRSQKEEERDEDAIRAFAYDLGLTLKKYCKIY